jgi:hypothetical protein
MIWSIISFCVVEEKSKNDGEFQNGKTWKGGLDRA